MNHAALFNGIGGFQLAADWMGWNNITSCEIDKFCNKVTKYHFPNCIQHEDIRTTDFSVYRGLVDIITGGFPCQPFSLAGERKGNEDNRHLWPEMLRAIREVQPSWVVGENVLGLIDWSGGLVFHEVQIDLEAEGYEVFPYVLPACGTDKDHKRDRVWFIAHSNSIVLEGVSEQHREFNSDGEGWRTPGSARSYPSIGRLFRQGNYRDICRGDGLPDRLDASAISFGGFKKESIKAYGNAIVPQVAFEIFKAIEQFETIKT